MEAVIKTLLDVLSIGLIVFLSLFILSMVVYFFNLDMKMSAMMQPLLNKWYNHHKRRPLP